MLKKIPVARLRPGMFIHELCGDWMSHPFWRAQFILKGEGDLRRIVEAGIQHVYIDTARGLDDVEAVAAEEVQAAVEQEIVNALSAPQEPIVRVSVREELARAKRIHEQAHKVIRSMMSDVRLGNAVSLDDAEPVVEAIIQHENGQQPYSDVEITKALVLAGVEPKQQSLQASRTVKGGQVATAGTLGAGAIETVQETLEPATTTLMAIAPYLEVAKWALLIVTLVGIGVMLWARIDDHRKGLR